MLQLLLSPMTPIKMFCSTGLTPGWKNNTTWTKMALVLDDILNREPFYDPLLFAESPMWATNQRKHSSKIDIYYSFMIYIQMRPAMALQLWEKCSLEENTCLHHGINSSTFIAVCFGFWGSGSSGVTGKKRTEHHHWGARVALLIDFMTEVYPAVSCAINAHLKTHYFDRTTRW